MEKSFTASGITIHYTHTLSARSKNIRFTIKPDGSCNLITPKRIPESVIDAFLSSREVWIAKKVSHYKNNPRITLGTGSAQELKENRGEVYNRILERLHFFAHYYNNVTWKNINIRNQSSRWGSCSKQGNLSFNYKMIHLPEDLFDYIVVHELCHLLEMNHSQKFWNLVEITIPNHKALRATLRSI